MQWLAALVLGIIQGLTEFIPVSSSGHLVLAEHFIHFSLSGYVFDAVLNIGTLAALLLYFWKDILGLLKGATKPGKEQRLLGLIILGTLPAGLVGWLGQDYIEAHVRSPRLVATALIVVALVMLLVEKVAKFRKDMAQIRVPDALAIGLAQIFAFIPGVSRSGATITAGMARGMARPAAARYSFLLALPVLGGGTLKILADKAVLTNIADNFGYYFIAIAAAFISGYLAIHWLLGFLASHKLNIFAYYRIALAAVILLVLGI